MRPTSLLAPLYMFTYNGDLDMDLDEDDLREFLSIQQEQIGKLSMT